MNGSIAFLTFKRDTDILVEADLNAVGFRVIHCKDFLVISSSFRLTLYANL